MFKKFISIFLVVLILFLFTSCIGKEETANTTTTPTAEVVTSEQLISKYYDYFEKQKTLEILLSSESGINLLNDSNMSGFACSNLIDTDYNNDIGIPRERYDEFTEKYFGKKISAINNNYTKILDNGNVVATGWSFDSSTKMLLKSIKNMDDGSKTAEFYSVCLSDGLFLDNNIVYDNETIKNDLMNCNFSVYKLERAHIVTINFFEKIDENGEFYLKYNSMVSNGSVTPDKVFLYNTITEALASKQLISKYYDYFEKQNALGLLFSNEIGINSINDNNMMGFTMFNLKSDYCETGLPKETFSEFTEKYFGKKISNFNTGFSKVLDNGNVEIGATGYYRLEKMLLKSITYKQDGSKTAEFYVVSFSDGLLKEKGLSLDKEQIKNNIMDCNLEIFELDTVDITSINFFEKIDENGEFYLQLNSIVFNGSVTPDKVAIYT